MILRIVPKADDDMCNEKNSTNDSKGIWNRNPEEKKFQKNLRKKEVFSKKQAETVGIIVGSLFYAYCA